ncbi:hypothetical protein [Streptomyces sp. NPDC090131]|uniref:hypothetical protein n=1 Tax=Streptomyces sp. NPDC090131 TaxID=3365954 RepID=UPI00380EA841
MSAIAAVQLFWAAGSAVADGPVVETGDAVRHTADLVGSVSQAAATRTGAPKLPYLCAGSVDHPHASRTAAYTINVHFDTKCRMTAPNVSTEGSLSRSRWYGWEQLKTANDSKANTRALRVAAPKSCEAGSKHRYKGQARFYVSGPEGKGSAHVYNQNDSEITCTKH